MRLFVAFDLPGEIRLALGEPIARLKPLCRAARWARPEEMHVTLKFIGHTIADRDAEKLDAARAALGQVRSSGAVEIEYRGVGFFPDVRRPRVVWCGVKGSARLVQLAADIERVLEPIGIPREPRAFVPHLTLARFKTPEGVDALVRSAAEWASRNFGSASETEFHLFESLLKPGGAEYRKIETYPFLGNPA
ncbi:MAG TPA: RNA 2',3'-cyclic phosphodiesterase [Candidatus Cybelea sp.]|nr:RNA 2',3'-cyclic phosphodiesterase [Candidatus Cybelea sp.]